MNLTMKRYSCFWIAALLLATSCVDHRYDYMVDDSAYFAKSDLQEETLSVMNAQDYVYEVWIHKSGYWQEKFAARLELDYNYLVQYNSTNGTDFEMLDEKYYTFERDFVIEEGENEACVPLTIKTEQILTDMGYGTYYIPLSVNSLTPGKEVYLEKSHFILALTLQQPVLKIDGIGFEDSDGNYDGNVSIDANTFSGDTYELDITAMLDVQTTEELEVIYQDGEVTEDERKLDSQYYTYNQSVIMPIDKQYAENYLTVNIKDMPDGKWVVPVKISTSNDKVQVNQEKSWVKLTVIKGSLDDAIPCIGNYAQGNEIIISADETLTNEIIASIEGREMSVSCVDNSTSEEPDWMSVSIVGSDVKLNVTNSNYTKRERVATITLTSHKDSVIILFVMSMFMFALLEYFTSYLLEKIFNMRWWDYSKNKFNITKLICCDKKIIGYFSLLADTIKINKLSEEDSNKLNEKTDFKELPAIKIGRFAIDETYTNKGLGTLILENIMNIIYILSTEYIGVRYITVDGYAKAYNFYEKNGFSVLKKDKETINNIDKIIKKDPERTIALYFDINRASKELNE